MIRMIVAVSFFLAFSPELRAQEVLVPALSGQVYVDGRPVEHIVEVRLESHNAAQVAAAHTMGSSRFIFSEVTLRLEESYYLVVREPGYQELRQLLHSGDFVRDSSNNRVYHFVGLALLDLKSLPKERSEPRSGPKTVEVDQLKKEISGAAKREYTQALEKLSAGDSPSALAHLEKAVEIEPKYYEALNKLGVEYLKGAQYRKAEQSFERACALDPKDPVPLINLGTTHYQEADRIASVVPGSLNDGLREAQESYRQAVSAFEKALLLQPGDTGISVYLGNALFKTGALGRAEDLLLKVLALNDRTHDARLTLINIYIRQRRFGEALKQISAFLDEHPDSTRKTQVEAIRSQIQNQMAMPK